MTDRTLNALRRKLEQWELAHLRQHCTELAERLPQTIRHQEPTCAN